MKLKTVLYLLLALVVLGLATWGCSRASSPDDSQIVSAVEAKLYQSPDLKNLSVNVTSDHGVVTLTGAVNAPLEKLAVEDVAMKTPGVKQVVDQLQVNGVAGGAGQDQSSALSAAPAPPPDKTEETAKAEAEARHTRRTHKAGQRELAENTASQANMAGEADANAANANDGASQAGQAAQAAPAAQPAPPVVAAPPPPPVQVSIPPGTTVSVRLIDSISSASAQQGQVFRASLFAPMVANDRVVIPKGADAKVRVTEVKSAGHYQGQSELQLQLISFSYNGTDYPVETGVYTKTGASRGKNTAEKVGGGAVLGTLLGAVIGHGKGAGIGAAIGGAAGAIDQTATHGQQVTLPSETELNFTLSAPLTLTLSNNNN